jgi:hypothetical protein
VAGPLLPSFQPAPDALIPVARELAADIGSLRARASIDWPLALAFNDLLDAARHACSDDPVLGRINRLGPEERTANGTVVALLGQIDVALGARA